MASKALAKKWLKLIKARGYVQSEALQILLSEIHPDDLRRSIHALEE